jgi:hypothetical protein
MKEFAELNKQEISTPTLDGEKSNITELIDKKIKIIAWKQINDRFSETGGMVTIVQCEHEGKKKVFFTRSKVLLDQMKKLNNDLPFAATIFKPEGKRYLSFK